MLAPDSVRDMTMSAHGSLGAVTAEDSHIRDVLLQICVRCSPTRSYGTAVISQLEAFLEAGERRSELNRALANVIRYVILSYPGARDLRHRPLPLAFDFPIFYNRPDVPVPVIFGRADDSDPYASKAMLRWYRKERDLNKRAQIAFLAAGSMQKAIDAATGRRWFEALYRLQGAWMRLWTGQHRDTTVEQGWDMVWDLHQGTKTRSASVVPRRTLGKKRSAFVIYHDCHEARDAWLHQTFEIWYHAAMVALHVVEDCTVCTEYKVPEDYMCKAHYLRRCTNCIELKAREDYICTAHWSIERAADQIRKFPSNWEVRRIQLDYARGWLFRQYAKYKDKIDSPFGKCKRPMELSARYFEAAAQRSAVMLGKYQRWTMELDYQVAYTDALEGAASLAMMALERLFHYANLSRPRNEREYHRICGLWTHCIKKWGKAVGLSKTQTGSSVDELDETYGFLVGLCKDQSKRGRHRWSTLRREVGDKLVAYQILDTRDVADEDRRTPAVKSWVLGDCGGEDVCPSCQRLKRIGIRLVKDRGWMK